MSGSAGTQRRFFPANVAGLDTRVWQGQGSSTKMAGVVFTRRGEVRKSPGIVPLTDWDDSSVPFNGRIDAMASFYANGSTELLFAYSDRISVLQGEGLSVIQSGRTTASRLRHSVRFTQVGGILIITNGRDSNMKWDGRHLTPLGVASPPSEPVTYLGEGSVDGIYTNLSWKEGDDDHEVEYCRTWVNDHGQESEASSPSNKLDTSAATGSNRYTMFVWGDDDTPSDDVVESNYYRRVDGGSWYFIQKMRGIRSQTFFDHIAPGFTSTDTLALTGSNLAPPLSLFTFPFRGRVYYRSVEFPSLLHYSRLINGTPAPESVASTNFIDVASGDGDVVTGWALAQDFAVVFKRRSMFQLTHDKTETPILAPVFTGVGAVSDRAIASMDGRVFFLSDSGVYVFDGVRVVPISNELNDIIIQLPPAYLEDAFAWASIEDRRIYFSVAREGDENRAVFAVHVDALGGGAGAAFSIIEDFPLCCALPYKHEVLVGFKSSLGGQDTWDLGQWNSSGKIRDDSFSGSWSTHWLDLGSPDSDKTFKWVEVVFVQTGNYSCTMEWFKNWDDRTAEGSTTFALADTASTRWDDGNWDTTRSWDVARTRSRRIAISDLTGKALQLRFSTAAGATPWKIVGFYIEWAEHGRRTEGTDRGANS